MALDFKTMSLEKKVVVCASLAIAAFGLIALIISFCVYGSVGGMMTGIMEKLKNNPLAALRQTNPLGGYGWIAALSFFALLGVAAINFFKAPESKLAPQVPFKFVIPTVVVLAGLFAWIYLAPGYTDDELTGFMQGKAVAAGVFTLIFFLCYTALFGFFAFENKDDLKNALPYCLLALGGLFLLIASIICVSYSGMDAVSEAKDIDVWEVVSGKVSFPSPLGFLKTAWIINSLCLIGYGCLTFLKAKDED